MPKPITLEEEIASLGRELAMRRRVYPNLRQNCRTETERANMLTQHTHEIACTEATLGRLQVLIPQQADLFA